MDIRKYTANVSFRAVSNWNKKCRFKNKKATIFKIYGRGHLIASCYIANNWIYNLVVNPKYRNKGYGKALLKEAEKEILKKYKTVNLTPQDNDPKLREFYSKLGYSGFTGNEPGYEEEDKTWWVMTKRRD